MLVVLKEKELQNGIIFREGDKVMQIRNNYKLEWAIYSEKGRFKIEEGVVLPYLAHAGRQHDHIRARAADHHMHVRLRPAALFADQIGRLQAVIIQTVAAGMLHVGLHKAIKQKT